MVLRKMQETMLCQLGKHVHSPERFLHARRCPHRVDNGMPLADVLQDHASWLDDEGLNQASVRRPLPVTWSGWDLAVRQYCFPCQRITLSGSPVAVLC